MIPSTRLVRCVCTARGWRLAIHAGKKCPRKDARKDELRERERVADARPPPSTRRGPSSSLIACSFVCFFFFLAHLLAFFSHHLFLSRNNNHRLAEALEDDGGAGGQGGGQANDGYDDGGKGGVSFFSSFCFSLAHSLSLCVVCLAFPHRIQVLSSFR